MSVPDDGFGPEQTPAEFMASLVEHLPTQLRSWCCAPSEPWVDPEHHDHGHTSCLFMNLAADEIDALRAEITRHHRDFARWEEMADKGARASAELVGLREQLARQAPERPVQDFTGAVPAELYNRLSDFAQWVSHGEPLLFSARRRAINVALTAAEEWVLEYRKAVDDQDNLRVRSLLGADPAVRALSVPAPPGATEVTG